jgi:hypothetical protein
MLELVYFGNNLISNNRFLVEKTTNRSLSPYEIQQIPLARGNGNSVVNTRIAAKQITIDGSVHTTDSTLSRAGFLANKQFFDSIFQEKSLYLRYVRDFKVLAVPTSTSGWSVSNGGQNLGFNTTNWQLDNSVLGTDPTTFGSVSFDLNPALSATNGNLTNSTLTAVDLSAVANTGNFETWLYIPDTYNVTSIVLSIGTDSSNYYSASLAVNYDGNGLVNGWNYFSLPWASFTTTGAPTTSNIKYNSIQVNYNASFTTTTGFLFGGTIWANESTLVNYPCYLQSLDITAEHGENEMINYSANFINYTGYGIATHYQTLFTQTGVTTTNNIQNMDTLGSVVAMPLFTITVNTATSISSFSLKNPNSSQQLDLITSSINAGDTFTLGDTVNTFKKNNNNVDFNGVIPIWNLARNKAQLLISGTSANVVSYATNNAYILDPNPDPYTIRTTYTYAQQFTTASANPITSVSFLLTPGTVGNWQWKLYSDSANSPNTLLSSGMIYSGNSNVGQKVYLTASGLNVAVTTATKYWLVFTAPSAYPVSSTSYVWVDSAAGYAGGIAKYQASSGGGWVTTWGSLPASTTLTNVSLNFAITQTPTPAWNVDWSAKYKPLYLS